jgi:hypothetical protein
MTASMVLLKQTKIVTVKTALKNATAMTETQHYYLKIEAQSTILIH